MTAVRAAAMLAALFISAPAQAQSAAGAQVNPSDACAVEAPPSPPPRRNPLGGLFAAARDSGLGQALVAQLEPSVESQAAAAVLSGDPAAALGAIPGARRDGRTARATAALAGVAANVARSAREAPASDCAAASVDAPPPAEPDVWN
ncbi:hypothetical protein [Brevundimonas sp.]|uniref:hypothetical protein n=1 Tax=Brevundimonas sp. TaxID=1871086 RepID=UPI0035B192BA